MVLVEPSANPMSASSSPFLLRPQDVDTLLNSRGFNILREHLAQHYNYDLCQTHTPTHLPDLPSWLLVRDALHAMLVPVVELYDKAILLSRTATHASQVEDLEYAFTGDARTAFTWLHSFLANPVERSWCYTRGCPACVVEHSLDSEFSLRLLYAACLLSDVHYPFTIDGPTLPSFRFFLDDPLRRAIARDPLFAGPAFAEALHLKANATRNGIEDLIRQCLDLDLLLSEGWPATPTALSPDRPLSPDPSSAPASPLLGPLGGGERPSAGRAKLKLKRSRLARRQGAVEAEQEAWMEEVLRRCWDELDGGVGGKPRGLDGEVVGVVGVEGGSDAGESDVMVAFEETAATAAAAVKREMTVQVSEVMPGT